MYSDEELPYFDELGNEYVRELNRQDAFIRRGGKLSAVQKIKYENRVAMLVERLIVIFEAIRSDSEAMYDYLQSIEETRNRGALPIQVYMRFTEKLNVAEPESHGSERERDRKRVITAATKAEASVLTDLPGEELLGLYRDKRISTEVFFQQLRKRQQAGIRLPRMESNLWSKYKTWVVSQRPRGTGYKANE